MCTNQFILQQRKDKFGKWYSKYYCQYKPEVHTDSFLNRLRLQHFGSRFVVVPCGKCRDCVRKAARDWKIRLYHERLVTDNALFITLTYNDEHLANPHLDYSDFQKFMKRLRRLFPKSKITYFVAGEYGTHTFRKHFHCIIYNLPMDFLRANKFFCVSRVDKRIKIFRNSILEKLWPFGYSSLTVIDRDDPRAFGYVSGYLISKKATEHKNRVASLQLEPEFHHMSLKPCLGMRYFLRNRERIYSYQDGQVWYDHKLVNSPRAYDRWYQKMTERFVIKRRYLDVDVFNYLFGTSARASCAEVTNFIYNLSKPYDIVLDKVSDYDNIKKKRKEKFNISRPSSTGLESLDIVLSDALYSNRDLCEYFFN